MLFDFDSIPKLINSPPGQLVAGGALAGIVWKFFEKVEGVLTDSTKHEISRWLRVRNFDTGLLVEQAAPWPATFAKVFDRVFGEKHLSWTCFLRSCVASSSALIMLSLIVFLLGGPTYFLLNLRFGSGMFVGVILFACSVGNPIPDYGSLLETRIFLTQMGKTTSVWRWTLLLGVDAIYTVGFAFVSLILGMLAQSIAAERSVGSFANPTRRFWAIHSLLYLPDHLLDLRLWGLRGAGLYWFYPTFFTSIWLWLYAGSGFLLLLAFLLPPDSGGRHQRSARR